MNIEPLFSAVDRFHVHTVLATAGLAGPHAFIRGLDAGYDLDVYLANLTREMDAQDDLRFHVTSKTSRQWVFMERLPWDSEFFSRGIARLNTVVWPGERLQLRMDISEMAAALALSLAKARERGIEYVFTAVAATDLPLLRMLHACGFALIETRCYYHRALSQSPAERYATRLAGPEDVESLSMAARTMVNHFDRFHADPCIDSKSADRLMERWVEASILHGFADATVVPDVQRPEAFCTAKYHKEHWDGWRLKLAQPVLSAVSPRHKGWYVRIISELDEHLRGIGAEHSFLITQLTNNAVIRCWEKLGYRFGKGEHVLRLIM